MTGAVADVSIITTGGDTSVFYLSFPTINLSMNSLNLVNSFWILMGKLLHVVKVSCTIHRNLPCLVHHFLYLWLESHV